VGEGVDLANGTEAQVSAGPGDRFSAPLAIRNAGETTAHGASVLFFNDAAIRSAKKFSNCTYVGDSLRTCHFDTDLRAGASYTAAFPYAVGADAYAPGAAYGENAVLTPAEFEDFTAYLRTSGGSVGAPGTEGKLTLSEVRAVAARKVQVDTDPSNNWGSLELTVTGKNRADLAAVGDTLTGAAGDVVTATVGLINKGPATLDATRMGGPVTRVDVVIPDGTTATDVPESCAPMKGDEIDWEHGGKAGAAKYRCFTGSFIAAGATETLDLKLRIDKVIANASGTVTINGKCECEGISGDLDPANDVAYLVVNETGGTGGGLPVTGASTGLIVAAGGVLLAAGAVGFVLTRRRRVRFVA
jgi:LPXTG-motif cell wall-anchored protein